MENNSHLSPEQIKDLQDKAKIETGLEVEIVVNYDILTTTQDGKTNIWGDGLDADKVQDALDELKNKQAEN